MNITEFPIFILDKIILNINDTDDYCNLRLTCKSFYNIINNIKRFYKNNKQLKELFFIQNNIVNGYYLKWNNNGIIEKMLFFINNKKNGSNKLYYDNGTIKLDIFYIDDIKDGIEKIYYDDGGICCITYYKENCKISERIYDINGSLQFLKTYYLENYYKLIKYQNKKIFIEGEFLDNKLHNKLSLFFFDKKLIYKYNYGNLLSKCTFDNQNNLIKKINYKNNIKHGLCYEWYSNNKLKNIKKYENNILIGVYLWSINHFTRRIINIKNNKINGIYKILGECIDYMLPYKNNKLNGYVCIHYKILNYKILLKFENNIFANIYKKIYGQYGKRLEIIISNDFLSYTKYYLNGTKNYIFKKKNNIYYFKYYNKNKKVLFETTII